MEKPPLNTLLKEALLLVVKHCPRLVNTCYWAGTSSVSLEELHHRRSFDLDFHTKKALADVRPLLTEMKHAFGDQFKLIQAPDEYGSGFTGLLTIADGQDVTIEVLANFDDVSTSDLTLSAVAPPLNRVSMSRYLADKVQCVVERNEARDLFDIMSVIREIPSMEALLRNQIVAHDVIMLTERLLGWTRDAVTEDLAAYDDVDVDSVLKCKQLMLNWIKDAMNETDL